MATATMGKAKPTAGASGDEGPGKKISLKVAGKSGDMVHKVAALRRLTVEELFLEKDVTTFFTHLLIAELKKEGERLKDQP